MLELFAGQADNALGIDRSSEMLRLARVKLAERGLTHTELRQADLYALPLGDGAADAAMRASRASFRAATRRGDRRGGARVGRRAGGC